MEKTYGILEPGLQAAIDLLEREARNEESNSAIADGRDDEVDAKTCAHHAWAYRQAIKLLVEQRGRLAAYPVGDFAEWQEQELAATYAKGSSPYVDTFSDPDKFKRLRIVRG